MGGGTGVEELQDVEEGRHKSGLAPRKCRRIVLWFSVAKQEKKKASFADKKIKDIRKGCLQTAQVRVHRVRERIGPKSGGDFNLHNNRG